MKKKLNGCALSFQKWLKKTASKKINTCPFDQRRSAVKKYNNISDKIISFMEVGFVSKLVHDKKIPEN